MEACGVTITRGQSPYFDNTQPNTGSSRTCSIKPWLIAGGGAVVVGCGIALILMSRNVIPCNLNGLNNVVLGFGVGAIASAVSGVAFLHFIHTRKFAAPEVAVREEDPFPTDPVQRFSLEEFRERRKTERWNRKADEITAFQARHKNIPFFTIDKLTHAFNRGHMGQLFSTTYRGESVVYKLDKWHAGARERDNYPCDSRSIGESGMSTSLWSSLKFAEFLDNLSKSSQFPKFLGIIYVKEKDQFGVLFEKIEGKDLGDWLHATKYSNPEEKLSRIQTVTILKDYAEGLKAMELAGHPHGDVKKANLMIRYPEKRGVIVDHEDSAESKVSALQTRQAFGCIIYQMFGSDEEFNLTYSPQEWDMHNLGIEQMKDKGIPPNIANLIHECWSYKPMQECNWDHIIQELNKVQN